MVNPGSLFEQTMQCPSPQRYIPSFMEIHVGPLVPEIFERSLAHLSSKAHSIPIEPASVCRPSVHHFQRSSSLKPLGHSKPNFMWSFLGKGEPKFV